MSNFMGFQICLSNEQASKVCSGRPGVLHSSNIGFCLAKKLRSGVLEHFGAF